MELSLSIEPYDVLVVRLREQEQDVRIDVTPAAAGAASLTRALQLAVANGYGECFWPAARGGQYWWMFKRDAESLEIIAMWTRGGASLWEHVFRATDEVDWVRRRLNEEIDGLGDLSKESHPR